MSDPTNLKAEVRVLLSLNPRCSKGLTLTSIKVVRLVHQIYREVDSHVGFLYYICILT